MGRKQVRLFHVESRQRRPCLGAEKLGLRLLGEREIEGEVPFARLVLFAGLAQTLLSILLHRFQQPIALAVGLQDHQ